MTPPTNITADPEIDGVFRMFVVVDVTIKDRKALGFVIAPHMRYHLMAEGP